MTFTTKGMAKDKLLIAALWSGVARLETVSREIAVGGVLYSVKVDDEGVHVPDDLAIALAHHLKKGRVFT